MTNEATKSPTSLGKLFSIYNRFFKLKPAIKKYMDVLKKERKVDRFANIVRCKASFSFKIKSLFISFYMIFNFLINSKKQFTSICYTKRVGLVLFGSKTFKFSTLFTSNFDCYINQYAI